MFYFTIKWEQIQAIEFFSNVFVMYENRKNLVKRIQVHKNWQNRFKSLMSYLSQFYPRTSELDFSRMLILSIYNKITVSTSWLFSGNNKIDRQHKL